jgi:hypothetical protein
MFTIDMNALKNLSPDDLKKHVEDVASHIEKGKDLKHVDNGVNKCALQALDQNMADNTPSKEVLDDLHTLLLTSIEKGLEDTHKTQLDAIRKIRQQALSPPSTALPGMDIISHLPEDAQKNILLRLSPKDLGPVKLVQKLWHQLGPEIQISMINDAKIPLAKVLENMTAKEAISWLKANPACKSLRYADFSNFPLMKDTFCTELGYADFTEMYDFDNDCLEELVKICPNLTHLHLHLSSITGEALEYLEKTPFLQSLDITKCKQLDPDALKNLKYTPALQSLDITKCKQLDPDALKNLKYTPALQSLNITECGLLDPDALKNLIFTPALQSLNITYCQQLERDALKNLQFTPALQHLNITLCKQLEPDALKHLENTPALQSLNIQWCFGLEPDALKHLKNTSALQSLNINQCNQLEPDALKNLQYTPALLSININYCYQLKKEKIPDELAFLLKERT